MKRRPESAPHTDPPPSGADPRVVPDQHEVSDEEKGEQIRQYLEGIEGREESVFRLGRDDRFFTDPSGIDPIALIPPEIKEELLGEFLGQGLEDPKNFEVEGFYSAPLPGVEFPETKKHIGELPSLWAKRSDELPVGRRRREKEVLCASRNSPAG